MAIKEKEIDLKEMREYNIYAGLGGSFGGARYLYTSLCASMADAEREAWDAAMEEYEQYTIYDGVPDMYECIEEARGDFNGEVEEDDPELLEIANQIYLEYVNDWCSYYAIPTDEDTDIDEEDLIRDYVMDDNDTGEASCE